MQNAPERRTIEKVLSFLRQEGLIREYPIPMIGMTVVAPLDVRRGTAVVELVEAIQAINPGLEREMIEIIQHSVAKAGDGRLLFRCSL